MTRLASEAIGIMPSRSGLIMPRNTCWASSLLTVCQICPSLASFSCVSLFWGDELNSSRLDSVKASDRWRFGDLLGVEPLLLTAGDILSEISRLYIVIVAAVMREESARGQIEEEERDAHTAFVSLFLSQFFHFCVQILIMAGETGTRARSCMWWC